MVGDFTLYADLYEFPFSFNRIRYLRFSKLLDLHNMTTIITSTTIIILPFSHCFFIFLPFSFFCAEHSVNQLAVDAFQTSPGRFLHWMACWVPSNGTATDRFWERCICRLHSTVNKSYPHLQAGLLKTYFKGTAVD